MRNLSFTFFLQRVCKVFTRSLIPGVVSFFWIQTELFPDLVRDASSGLYYDPEIEVVIGITDGPRIPGRIVSIHQGILELRDADSRLHEIPLHRLDVATRERLLSFKPPMEIESGILRVASPFENLPIIEVSYQMAMVDGKPAPAAADLVFIAPYLGEKDFFHRPHHLRMTAEHGLTVFSFPIPTTLREVSDPARGYPSIPSGWPLFVFHVQKKLMDHLGLPRRKLFICGESSGAKMAANMAIQWPQWVEAVAVVGGGNYDEPTPEVAGVAWCILHTNGDFTTSDNRWLHRRLQELGAPAVYGMFAPKWELRNVTKNFRHSPNPNAERAQADFLAAIAERRREAVRWVPDPSVETIAGARETRFPLHFPVETAEWWSWEGADLSENFAASGQARMLEPRFWSVAHSPNPVPVMIAFPVGGQPRAIAIHYPQRDAGSPDGLNFLAGENILAIGVEVPRQADQIMPSLTRVHQQVVEWYPDLPVYLITDTATFPSVIEGFGSEVAGVAEIVLEVDETMPGIELAALRNTDPLSVDITVVDARPDADRRTLASDDPLYQTGIRPSRTIRIPGDNEAETGERWLAIWSAIAERCR